MRMKNYKKKLRKLVFKKKKELQKKLEQETIEERMKILRQMYLHHEKLLSQLDE